jgi:hypothetical protein
VILIRVLDAIFSASCICICILDTDAESDARCIFFASKMQMQMQDAKNVASNKLNFNKLLIIR